MKADRRLSVILALVWILLDQLSKHWAVNRLGDGSVVEVVWILQLDLSFNSGMAFGQGRGLGPIIGVVALVVLVVLLVGMRVEGRVLSAVGVGLVVGGAAGNVIDRLVRGEGWLRGSVVDFIDLGWWPVFNVADIGVTVGAAMLLLGSLQGGRRRPADDAVAG